MGCIAIDVSMKHGLDKLWNEFHINFPFDKVRWFRTQRFG